MSPHPDRPHPSRSNPGLPYPGGSYPGGAYPGLPYPGTGTMPRRGAGYLRLSTLAWAAILSVAIGMSLFSTEPLLIFASLLTLPLGAMLLWRIGEPPILYAVFFLQWLSISTGVFQAAMEGLSLAELLGVPGMVEATWLSLIGLLMLAGGMRLALRGSSPPRVDILRQEVHGYSLSRITRAYLFAVLFFYAFDFVIWRIPGLSQALLALTGLRWVIFFVLAVKILMERRGYGLLALAFGYELASGFLSFFSDYKFVVLILGLAFVVARPSITTRTLSKLLLIFVFMVALSALWSAIKADYRSFLNQGTGAQTVLVNPTERAVKLQQLVADAGIGSLSLGLERLLDRVMYTEYFGRVVDRIPAYYPHERGTLWLTAVVHVLTPRLFFPEKAALTADIENTARYTGLNLMQEGGNTEISLGYMAECYIDFGAMGMFIPIGLLGFLYGFEYRYFVSRPRNLLFAYGAAVAVLKSAGLYETTIIKVLGGNLTTFITLYLALRFLVPGVSGFMRRKPD